MTTDQTQPATATDFEVGDRVRIVNTHQSGRALQRGEQGTIRPPSPQGELIGFVTVLLDQGTTVDLWPWRLEKIEEQEPCPLHLLDDVLEALAGAVSSDMRDPDISANEYIRFSGQVEGLLAAHEALALIHG